MDEREMGRKMEGRDRDERWMGVNLDVDFFFLEGQQLNSCIEYKLPSLEPNGCRPIVLPDLKRLRREEEKSEARTYARTQSGTADRCAFPHHPVVST
eukprot:750084-Hanusia_phi.AAC.1